MNDSTHLHTVLTEQTVNHINLNNFITNAVYWTGPNLGRLNLVIYTDHILLEQGGCMLQLDHSIIASGSDNELIAVDSLLST